MVVFIAGFFGILFYLFLIIIVVLVVKFIARSLNSAKSNDVPEEDDLPFIRKDSVMTNAEQRCFRRLESEYGDTHYIFPQVGLDKLVHTTDRQHFYRYWNKINKKSVDFVLVDKVTLETVMLIELHDYTHSFTKRQQRDEFLRKICEKTGIELKVLN